MTIRRTTAMLAAVAMLAVGACAKKAPEELPPAPEGTDTGSTDTGIGNAVIPGSQQDFVANVSSDRIFFDFDQYNVDAEDQATLRSQAQWLQRNPRSEEHTSELQSLMRISYAVFCLTKKTPT